MNFMDRIGLGPFFSRQGTFYRTYLPLLCCVAALLTGMFAASALAAGPVGTGVSSSKAATGKLETVAMVNAKQITRNEIGRLAMERYGKDVLQSLVHKHLIMDACQRQNIAITSQDVETEIVRVAKKFNLTPKQWFEMLEKERHIGADQYRNDIIWPTLALRRLAKDKLIVTKEELDKAIESNYGPRVAVRMISVSSRKKAEEVHKLAVANPAEFGTFAKDNSEDVGSASARGLIPPIRRHMGEPEIEKIAFALKPGQVSPIIHVANQYIILKCDRHIPGATISPGQRQLAAARLIDRIREEKMRGAAGEVFAELKKNAKIMTYIENPEMAKTMPGIAAVLNGRKLTKLQLSRQCFDRHGGEILDREIQRQLLVQALESRKLTVTAEDLKKEATKMAYMYAHFNKAGEPDVDAWLKEATANGKIPQSAYVQDHIWPAAALKKLTTGSIVVDREDIRRAYEANYGEQVEVAVIVFENQRKAMEVWEWARANPSEEYFGKLASEYSIEPVSKANNGRVPPIRRWTGQKGLEKEAFKLNKGDLSGVVVVGGKCIIMKCLGRRKPSAPKLAEIQNTLYEDVYDKKQELAMADTFERIQASARIDNYLTGTSHAPDKTRKAAPPVRQASGTGTPRSSIQQVPFNQPK